MSNFSNVLEETLDAWQDTGGGQIAGVRNIPVRRFAFRPTPQTRSVAQLVQHILER